MAGDRRRIATIWRVTGSALVLATALAGLAACTRSGEGEEDCDGSAACAEPLPTNPPAAPVDLMFRPVLSSSAGSGAACPTPPDTAPADGAGDVPECTNGVVRAIYSVGPVEVDGSALASAHAVQIPGRGEWAVNPFLRSGADGLDAFNAAAAHCFARDTTCPTGQLAIILNGVVISAPTIQAQHFEADQIQISPLTEESAKALAASINANS